MVRFWKVFKRFIEKYNFSLTHVKTKLFNGFIMEESSSFPYLGQLRNSWTWDKLRAPNSSEKVLEEGGVIWESR